jgi:SAM-dependent methyltransferase
LGDPADQHAAVAEHGPIGQAALVSAVTGAQRILDAGCGSGRLTVALARTGAAVTGVDTSREQLAQARKRAAEAGIALRLVEADFNAPLPFPAAAFDAATSRLALMAARDPVATLRGLGAVLEPGGRLATAIWASLAENPWFAVPRETITAVLGDQRASFARAFGRLGDADEAADVHRAAGLRDVQARVMQLPVVASDAAAHWNHLARENGHFRRIDASLTNAERIAVITELERRSAHYRVGNQLRLPRALVLVTARC